MERGLVTRCRQGDEAAWTELYGAYARAVYRWLLFFGIDKSSAEEVLQEVFVTVVKRISTCLSDERLSPWLFQITRRHAANFRRTAWFKKVFRLGENEPQLKIPERKEDGTHVELNAELQQILRQMPIALTEILIMHDLDGYSRREIASLLGIPEGTVANRLKRARSTLRREWQQG